MVRTIAADTCNPRTPLEVTWIWLNDILSNILMDNAELTLIDLLAKLYASYAGTVDERIYLIISTLEHWIRNGVATDELYVGVRGDERIPSIVFFLTKLLERGDVHLVSKTTDLYEIEEVLRMATIHNYSSLVCYLDETSGVDVQ